MLTAVVSLWYPSGILIKRDWLPLSKAASKRRTTSLIVAIIHDDEVGRSPPPQLLRRPSLIRPTPFRVYSSCVIFSGLYSRMAVVRRTKSKLCVRGFWGGGESLNGDSSSFLLVLSPFLLDFLALIL